MLIGPKAYYKTLINKEICRKHPGFVYKTLINKEIVENTLVL